MVPFLRWNNSLFSKFHSDCPTISILKFRICFNEIIVLTKCIYYLVHCFKLKKRRFISYFTFCFIPIFLFTDRTSFVLRVYNFNKAILANSMTACCFNKFLFSIFKTNIAYIIVSFVDIINIFINKKLIRILIIIYIRSI